MQLNRAKWSPTASSAVCSCHFAPEDFTRKLSFGTQKCQRTLVMDEIGIALVPRFHRNTFEQEELSDRSRRQVSLLCYIDHNNVRCLVFAHILHTLARSVHTSTLSLILFPLA